MEIGVVGVVLETGVGVVLETGVVGVVLVMRMGVVLVGVMLDIVMVLVIKNAVNREGETQVHEKWEGNQVIVGVAGTRPSFSSLDYASEWKQKSV